MQFSKRNVIGYFDTKNSGNFHAFEKVRHLRYFFLMLI